MRRSVDIQDQVKAISRRSEKSLGDLRKTSVGLPPSTKSQVVGALMSMERNRDQLRAVIPETRSVFSRLLLGKVNVKCFSDREREKLRDEYNKFKLRTNFIFILLPLVVLFFHFYLRHQWKDTHWINVLHNLWMLYYFVSLALRENILLVNGSDIRPWWIYHHYFSSMASIAWLVWPDTDIQLSYVPWVTSLCFYIGIVQAMQMIFYGKRDYANRALGKSAHMDISYPETLTDMPKELLILIPFLLVAHLWQIMLGVMFLRTLFDQNIMNRHWTEYREELQLLSCGVLGLTVGAGNLISTILTVYTKANKKRIIHEQKKQNEMLEQFIHQSKSKSHTTNGLTRRHAD